MTNITEHLIVNMFVMKKIRPEATKAKDKEKRQCLPEASCSSYNAERSCDLLF